MAERDPARADAGHFERNHLPAEQPNQPANRPDEAQARLAGPAHRLRPVDLLNHLGQSRRENFRCVPAGDLLQAGHILAFGGTFNPQVFDGDTHLPGESGGCARRLPFLEGGALGRPHQQLFGVRLAVGDVDETRGQPAGRGVHREQLTLQPVFGEHSFQQLAQVVQRGLDHPIGYLFNADFEQEVQPHHATSPAAGACWSTHACATPTAILRTRPMTPTRSVTLMAPRESRRLKRLEHFST